MILGKYRLKKDMPGLSKGAMFEHREYDKAHPDRGNIGCGVMILAWGKNGSCQQYWCGETFILPGQMAKNKDWFEPLEIDERALIMEEIEKLKKRVENL